MLVSLALILKAFLFGSETNSLLKVILLLGRPVYCLQRTVGWASVVPDSDADACFRRKLY
jgi:hypothetical protein